MFCRHGFKSTVLLVTNTFERLIAEFWTFARETDQPLAQPACRIGPAGLGDSELRTAQQHLGLVIHGAASGLAGLAGLVASPNI